MDDDFKQLEKYGKNTVDDVIKWLSEVYYGDMEAIYETLKNSGKTSVDGIIQWMKDAKIIDGIKVTEEKARSMFCDVVDKQNVNLENFKEALSKLAAEQKRNIEDLYKTLTTEAPKFLDALKAGASAFKDTLTKKD